VYVPQVTQEGEELPYYQHELTVGGDGEEDKIFFIWPTTIVHKIDPASPLYHLSAAEMIRERFEIVVILEGKNKHLLDKAEHLPYFSIDNAHLMYNVHPKLFRYSF
jgi:hypothetical protein